MTDTSIELSELSEAEQEMLTLYVRKAPDIPFTSFDYTRASGDPIKPEDAQEIFEHVLALFSKDVESVTLQALSLNRLEEEIKQDATMTITPGKELPDDATLTPELLAKLFASDKVLRYFMLAGGLIETLTIELVMSEVVHEDRRSNAIEEEIDRMAQSERIQLLYITGVLDDGEKGKVQRAYDLRSSLVHDPQGETVLSEIKNLESDMERTRDAIDLLHEKRYGITINQRIGELLIENAQPDES